MLGGLLNLSRRRFWEEPWVQHMAVVLAILALSGILGLRPSPVTLLIIVGAFAALFLVRSPLLGLPVLLVGSIVFPFTIGTGTQTAINITILLIPALLGLWIADMFRHGRARLVPSQTTLPIVLLAISAVISFIAGDLPWDPFARTAPITAQVGGLATFVLSAGVFLLVGNQVTDLRWLKLLVALFLAIGALYMIGRINPILGRFAGTINANGSDGSMFWVWLVALASGQLFFNQKLSPVVRAALGLLIALTVGIGWFLARTWTSGYLPPMIAIGTILWLRSPRLGLLAAGLAGIAIILTGHTNLLNSLIELKSYSILTRDVARDILITQVLPLSPIIGLGPANYYWYAPLYSILGWYVSFNSHNNYVDILMQTGVVGLVSFLWVMAAIGLLGWRLRKCFKDDFAQGYVYACLGGLAGTMVSCWLADWLIPFVYNIGLRGFRASVLAWLFMGGLVSLEQIARKSTNIIPNDSSGQEAL